MKIINLIYGIAIFSCLVFLQVIAFTELIFGVN